MWFTHFSFWIPCISITINKPISKTLTNFGNFDNEKTNKTYGYPLISKSVVQSKIISSKEEVLVSVEADTLKRRFEENQEVIKEQTKSNAVFKTTDKIIAIGASTGGTEAVKDVITALPSNMPPIVIAQHMPPNFTKSWAERMNSLAQIEVCEAKEGDEIAPGKALVAPGGYHMTIRRSGARYYVELNQDEPVWHQRPAVDVLFESVAKYAGKNAIGVIMTGMGRDGASGLKAMRDAGAYTIGQDEKTSIVYGMPKVAFEEGAVCEQQPLNSIAKRLMELV